MKNLVLVVLGIVVVLAIVLFKKNGMNNSSDDSMMDQSSKVFISDSGQELKFESSPEPGYVTFSEIGTVNLLEGKANASGVEYKNEDGSIVFWYRGLSAMLLQNGNIIFEGRIVDKKI